MALPRPTTIQEQALREAIAASDRMGPAYDYTPRTMATMTRNGWIELDQNQTMFRVLPEGARILGMFSLADRYAHEDALAGDPIAQRTDVALSQAASLGLTEVTADTHDHGSVILPTRILEMLLAAYASTPHLHAAPVPA